ncbi:MAG TPA: hypothetical protein PKY12_05910 [Catalimonadaceae bacterium]|jgi:tetratricopeptide (TPR) repeat protein|nr:hypothetical protein [Catalimonadaceae bacterium]
MEAVVFFIIFGLYLFIRVLMGGGETAWEKSRDQFIEGKNLLEKGDIQAAKSYFETKIKKHPSDVFILVNLGHISLLENEPERALSLAQKAMRSENSISEVHLLMSKGMYAIQDFEASLKHAKNAIWFGRNNAEAEQWLGTLLVESGDVENGLNHLETAYSLDQKLTKKWKSEIANPFSEKRKM